jgi:hypothetical protein
VLFKGFPEKFLRDFNTHNAFRVFYGIVLFDANDGVEIEMMMMIMNTQKRLLKLS